MLFGRNPLTGASRYYTGKPKNPKLSLRESTIGCIREYTFQNKSSFLNSPKLKETKAVVS